MMTTFLKNSFSGILMLLLCCILPQHAQATHAMGADLTYECLGNNQYKIKLSTYRDCNGINMATTQLVQYQSNTCGITSVVTLQQVNMMEIPLLCPGTPSRCQGSGAFGVQRFDYEGIITLPSGCTDWKLSWELCCRNNAITTLFSPGSQDMFITALLDNTATPCNNSPEFLNNPTVFSCVNQPIFYNHGAYDVDGDELRYSLVACQQSSTQTLSGTSLPVNYTNGRSPSAPLFTTSGVTINAQTGAIQFTPNQIQVGVLCVMVEEYRNNVKIGQVVRDIQFTVINCANQLPTVSGINNTTDYTITVQAGTSFCFDVFSADADAAQITNLTWNQGIPNATFTVSGNPRANGHFCWTPTLADIGQHSFTVAVTDNSCPMVGSNTFTYTIVVLAPTPVPCTGMTAALVSSHDVVCSTNDGSAVLTAAGGTAPYTYQVVNWTTGAFFSNTTGIFNNLTIGSYGVLITDANGCHPSCSNINFSIGGNPNPFTGIVSITQPSCATSTGCVTLTAVGGTAPYLYSVGNSRFQTSNTFCSLLAGSYLATIMDANGCSFFQKITIVAPAPLVATASSQNATCGNSNGSIEIITTGGTAPYTYEFNGQSNTTGIFTNVAGGYYTILITDAHQCTTSVQVNVADQPAIVATISSSNATCANECNGSAIVTATGGSGALSFAWSNGADGATLSNLCAGVYIVTISDQAGCVVVATANITEPAPLQLTLASSSDETCARNDGSANISITGGTAPYAVQLANFTAGSQFQSTSGQFTGLTAGAYVAQVTDANGCTQNCVLNFTLGGCQHNPLNPNVSATVKSNNYLQISPNPAQTLALVSYHIEEAKTVAVSILDGNGKVLLSKEPNSNQFVLELNINDWSPSTYFVVLQNEAGQILMTKKLVIAR